MIKSLLNREDSPFDNSFWNKVDNFIVEIAKRRLSARKIIESEEFSGIGSIIPQKLKKEILSNGIEFMMVHGKPLVQFLTRFTLSEPEIYYFSENGIESGLDSLIKAVCLMSSQEDDFIFNGFQNDGKEGILNIPGTHTISFPLWDSCGAATETILAGVEKLDRAGFHGPYSLALSPILYSKLFLKYPQASLPEIKNIESIAKDGVVKSGTLKNEGVLIASGKEYASIIIGQDLIAGFEGPSGREFVFTLSESILLKVNTPEVICKLNVK